MLEWIFMPEAWISLMTLTALEIVLGIDNIIFIINEYIIKYLYSALQLKTKLNYYKNSIKLSVTNKGMYEDLVSHGMVENKSHSEYHFPQIPKEFYNSFILGYFDGDGCITIKSSGAIVV